MASEFSVCQAAVISGGHERITVLPKQQRSGCGSCASASICNLGTSLTQPAQLSFSNDRAAPVPDGASVDLRLPASALAQLSVLCFLFPAVLMVVGALIGSWLAPSGSEIWAVIGTMAGLAVGATALRLYDSRGGGQYWLARISISPSQPD